MNLSKTNKKIIGGIVIIFILSLLLALTTFALVYETVSVENNFFRTGLVKINLNDGEPVITEDDFLFEPGMTVEKEFFIENRSTWDVWYKIYFEHVSGPLADVIEVSVLDGETTLCSGKMSELTREHSVSVSEPLSVMEKKTLTVRFFFPKDAGNQYQRLQLSFDMAAEAVQTKNNPAKDFG